MKLGRHDWYRNTVWDDNVKAQFLDRLAKSRSAANKAQYMRIQALYLEECINTKFAVDEAIDLLSSICRQWPESSELQSVYGQLATCHLRVGNKPLAISYFQEAFAARRRYPNHHTDFHLHFSLLVASEPLPDLYAEALAVMKEFESSQMPFPLTRFMHASSHALIHSHLGNKEARSWAQLAIEDSNSSESDFPRHAHLGLVRRNEYADLIQVLERIAA